MSDYPSSTYEPVPIKRIKRWDESNHTRSGPEDRPATTTREVVLTSTTGENPCYHTIPKELKYVSAIKLQECYLPTLWYNVKTTQTIAQSNGGGALASVIFPPGIYTQSAIISQFSTAGASTCTFSALTGQCNITFTVNNANHVLDFTAAPQMQSLLGFAQTITTQAGQLFTGMYPANLFPINAVHIRSRALSSLLVDSVISTPARDQTVWTLPMTHAPSSSYLYYIHPDGRPSLSCHGGDVQTIDLEFVDDSGNVLDFHNQPYTLKFEAVTDGFYRR